MGAVTHTEGEPEGEPRSTPRATVASHHREKLARPLQLPPVGPQRHPVAGTTESPMPPKSPADTLAEMSKKLAQLEAENEALKKAKIANNGRLTLKVSELGALSVYGMGRFPTTLYAAQWEALLAKGSEVQAFIVAHKAEFATGKDDLRFLKVRAERAAKAEAEKAGSAGKAGKAGTAL